MLWQYSSSLLFSDSGKFCLIQARASPRKASSFLVSSTSARTFISASGSWTSDGFSFGRSAVLIPHVAMQNRQRRSIGKILEGQGAWRTTLPHSSRTFPRQRLRACVYRFSRLRRRSTVPRTLPRATQLGVPISKHQASHARNSPFVIGRILKAEGWARGRGEPAGLKDCVPGRDLLCLQHKGPSRDPQ